MKKKYIAEAIYVSKSLFDIKNNIRIRPKNQLIKAKRV